MLNSKVPLVPDGAPSELVRPLNVIFLLSEDKLYVPVNLRPSNSVNEAAVVLDKSSLNWAYPETKFVVEDLAYCVTPSQDAVLALHVLLMS